MKLSLFVGNSYLIYLGHQVGNLKLFRKKKKCSCYYLVFFKFEGTLKQTFKHVCTFPTHSSTDKLGRSTQVLCVDSINVISWLWYCIIALKNASTEGNGFKSKKKFLYHFFTTPCEALIISNFYNIILVLGIQHTISLPVVFHLKVL